VIIATYAMAAEALDIKSLTTLMLSTPKTDVVQAVGRILRQTGHQPVVLDIIDSHEPFRNQWNKRMAYYKKEGYEIHTTDNKKYLKDEWQKMTARQTTSNKKLKQSTNHAKETTISVNTTDLEDDEEPAQVKRKCVINIGKLNIKN
jgi:hypothetical protein